MPTPHVQAAVPAVRRAAPAARRRSAHRGSAPAPADAQAAPHPFAQMLKQNQAPQPTRRPRTRRVRRRRRPSRRSRRCRRRPRSTPTTPEAAAHARRPRRRAGTRAQCRAPTSARPRARRAAADRRAADNAIPFGERQGRRDRRRGDAASTPVDPAFAALAGRAPADAGCAAARRGRSGRRLPLPSAASSAPPTRRTAHRVDDRAVAQRRPRDRAEPPMRQRAEPDAKAESKAFADLVAQRLAIELPAAALAAERASAPQQRRRDRDTARGHRRDAALQRRGVHARPPAAAPIAAPVDVRLADAGRLARLRAGARRPGQRARQQRRAARRAAPEPGRDGTGLGADRRSTAPRPASTSAPTSPPPARRSRTACPSWPARCATPASR